MNFLKKQFKNYTALFLLLPFSWAIGVYIFRSFQLLKDNPPFLFFYALVAVAPLYFLFFRPNQGLGEELIEVLGKLSTRLLKNKWAYLIIALVYSLLFLYMGTIHISTYMVRDEWILEYSFPILPHDLIVLPRLVALLVGFLPIDLVVPFVNLLFVFLWLSFLIYVTPVSRYSWAAVLLVSTTAFSAVVLYPVLHATFEFNAAVVSFIGMYSVWRRKYNLGLFLLIVGGVSKNTALFHVVAGGIFLLFVLWKTGNLSIEKIQKVLNIPLVFFGGLYVVMSHWALWYYVIINNGSGGPIGLATPDSDQVFWLSSFLAFILYIFQNSQATFVLGLVGIFLSKEMRIFAVFSLGLLLVVRSFLGLVDAQYAIMFLPALSYFSLISILKLWEIAPFRKVQMVLYVLLFSLNIYSYGWNILHPATPGGMNHMNSNFDEFIAKLARRFPEDGYIYQKSISIKPYLEEARGGDLDAIRFRPFPELRQEALSELSLPGCKLIVVDKNALAEIGISEMDLIEMGYSDRPYILTDPTGIWVSYSKECNPWEFEQ